MCAHDGHPFARYWLHNGMLTVGGAKMAKSEGNFITVRDALAEAPGEVIRLALARHAITATRSTGPTRNCARRGRASTASTGR